jgi:signal transduction histidine kinase/HAMP domain-containing protein
MRLEFRVTAWMAVLLGAAAALALGLMARFEASRMENQWTEAGLAMAQATENTLEVSMLNDAPEDIRQAVRNINEGALVEGVSVYGRDGVPWVRSDPSPTSSELRHNALMASMSLERSTTSAENDVLSVFVPVPKQPECIACHAGAGPILGAVEVRLDEGPFRSELASSAQTSLIVAAIPLLLGIVLSVSAIRRKVLRPLGEVDEAVERLGDGDLSVRLPVYRAPEFGEVATTFNDMAERLELQTTDVRATVETLRAELTVMEEIRAMLTRGAGLAEVLQRAAGHLGAVLDASGVVIRPSEVGAPIATWGAVVQEEASLDRSVREGRARSSAGYLDDVPNDLALGWVTVPATVRGVVLAVVGVAWNPSRSLAGPQRDLLKALAGLVGIAVDNAALLDDLRHKEASLQGLVRKTLTAQEEERRRIARELHDETSQVVSALLMNISVLESQAALDENSRTRVEAVKSLAEEAARNLDTMLFELRPALLDELGLIPAIRWYVAQVSEAWSVPIAFEGGRTGRLPDFVEVTAFRIVQEAVGNVVRHAHASSAQVKVSLSESGLRVEVTDDGTGFDPVEAGTRARTGESVGLMGMRERAEIAGGWIRIESTPGQGTSVVAEIPISEREGAVV